MNYEDMTVLNIKRSKGVSDLPSKAASFFAMALKAEAQGDYDKAQFRLDEAIQVEALT